MISYDSVSPTPLTAPFAAEEEEAFWSLFDGVGGVTPAVYMGKYIPMSGSSSRADGSGMSDDMSSSTSSISNSLSRPRTIESFLAAYATPAPSTTGAPATPQITPTLPSVATFAPTPFTPAPTGMFYTTHSSDDGRDGEPANPQRRELKRQRNTEASARFRLRKKQRENELESHASESISSPASATADSRTPRGRGCSAPRRKVGPRATSQGPP